MTYTQAELIAEQILTGQQSDIQCLSDGMPEELTAKIVKGLMATAIIEANK